MHSHLVYTTQRTATSQYLSIVRYIGQSTRQGMKVGGSSLECFVPGMAVLCQVSYTSWVSEITQLTSVILFDPAFSPDPF